MLIRKARKDEIDDIEKVYADARAFMREAGNAEQWANGYPPHDRIEADIEAGRLFVCEEGPMLFAFSDLTESVNGYEVVGGSGNAHAAIDALHDLEQQHLENAGLYGVFYFAVEDEPAYATIDGAWLNDAPYGVVHRIAIARRRRGVGTFCLEWAQKKAAEAEAAGGVRIDTHPDNTPMREMLSKLGFTECGTVTYDDCGLRIAFQKLAQ